jgi:hypothetical protein
MLRLTTHTGSTYEVDEKAGTVRRTESTHDLPYDGEALPYSVSYIGLVGQSAAFLVTYPDGREKYRTTSAVTSIETIGDSTQ